MKAEFVVPDFTEKELEFRFENEVVCIYGTKEGLNKLIDLCCNLIKHPGQGHIHVENYGLTTRNSKKCAIAIFGK